MRICIVILAGVTVAVHAQIASDGDQAYSENTDASLSSSEEYSDVDVSGSADVLASSDLNESLEICIQSCACSCAAHLGISASGPASVDGQDASASGDASPNPYFGSCDSLLDASLPDAGLPDDSLPDDSLPDDGPPDASLPNDSLPGVPSGYVYAIGVHRNSLVYSANDVVYTDVADENTHPITYYETVDVDHPFMIDGWLWNSTNDILTIPGKEAINACLEYEEGTWEKLAVDIILKQLSPTGSCPINPGTYNIYKDFQVVETFDEMISCNAYEALLYVTNSKGQWAFQMAYDFTVDEGQCASD